MLEVVDAVRSISPAGASPQTVAYPPAATAVTVISSICRAASTVRAHMEHGALADYDLSWRAFNVMWALRPVGEFDAQLLARQVGISKATLSGLLKTLEGHGFVGRCPHPDDRRRVIVHLLPAGRRAVDDLLPRYCREAAAVTSSWQDDERLELIELLQEVQLSAGGAGTEHGTSRGFPPRSS